MKHIIYLFFAFFTCINIAKAQVKISTRDLNGTKWQYSNYEDIYEYQSGKKIWHRSDGSTFTYQIYLSDAIPTIFDFSKVGRTTLGHYLIEYNPKQDIFFCYAITRFNKEEKIMNLRLVTENVIGNSGVASFTLIYSPKSNPKSTYDTPLDPIVSKEYDVLERDTSTGTTSTSGQTSTSGNSSTGKSTSTGGGATTNAQTNTYIGSQEQLKPLK